MLIERTYTMDASVPVVWNVINNVDALAKCVPDLEQVIIKNNQRFILVVRPKLAFIKGNLEMDCTLKVLKNNTVTLKIKGKSIGSSFEAISKITLTNKKTKTILQWNIEIILKGLLKHVPESVIRATAYFIAGRMIKNLIDITRV